MKKTLVILVIILAVVLIGFLIYNFGPKKEKPPATESALPDLPAQAGKPTVEPGPKIKALSQKKVTSADLGPDNQTIRYYLASNGNVFEVDFDGENSQHISSAVLTNLLKVLFSPTDKEEVISIFQEEGQIKKYFYDFETGRSAELHENTKWVTWSPDGQKIAYQFIDPAKKVNNISIADPDGNNWQNIFETRLDDLIIQWPSQDKLSFHLPGTGIAQNSLYLINPDGTGFSKIISDIYGLTVKWSPKGDKFIFSSTDERGKNLKINLADAKGQNQKILNFVTLPEKCIFNQDSRYLFCAVPQQISPYASWPDDYKKRIISTEDDFYKIDLATKQKTRLFSSSKEKAFDAKGLILSPQEDYLFFINQRDGLLYALRL